MTNLSEAKRTQIYTELAEATSSETAEILMHEMLDVRWDDVATKADLRIGFAEAEAHLERRLRSQLMWIVATMISLFSLLGALVVLVG